MDNECNARIDRTDTLIVVLDIPLPEVFGPDLWRKYELRMQAKETR